MVNATQTTWTSELDKARDALSYIDSDDRKEWLLVGAALKNAFGQEAFELWDSWSANADSYNAATAKYTWRQLKLNSIGIGALFHLAKQGGFDPSGRIGYETLSLQAKQEQAQLRAKRTKERAAEQALELAKQEDRYSKVASLSEHIWQSSSPASDDHPYLIRKGITGENLHEIDLARLTSLIGYSPKANGEPLVGRILLAGVGQRDGENHKMNLSTLEMIDEAGKKSALAGGRKSQSYWVALNPSLENSAAPVIYIGEGIATTRSIEQSYSALKNKLGLPDALIVASLSSGNMPSVAQTLRAQYPQSMMVLASDIGRGEREAIQAALLVNGLVAKPSFSPADLVSSASAEKTDFNDLQLVAGNQSVVIGLLSAQTPQGLGFALVDGRAVDIAGHTLSPEPVLPSNNAASSDLDKNGGSQPVAQAGKGFVVPMRGFDNPNQSNEEVQISQGVARNPGQFIDRYKVDSRSHDGSYINIDLFKETFDSYRQSTESRNLYNLPSHNSAAALADTLFHQNIEVAQAELAQGTSNRNRVLLVNGIPGAGKSTFIKGILDNDPSIACIYEGPLTDYEVTKIKIDQILEAGLDVNIVSIHSKAENLLDASLIHFEEVGRGAGVDEIALSLSTLPQTLERIRSAYGDTVKITIVDRTHPNNAIIARDWEYLPNLSSEGTYEDIKERLSKQLERLYESGEINHTLYGYGRGQSPERSFSRVARQSLDAGSPVGVRPSISESNARAELLESTDLQSVSAVGPQNLLPQIELSNSDLSLLANAIDRIPTVSSLAQYEKALEVIFGEEGLVRDFANGLLLSRRDDLTSASLPTTPIAPALDSGDGMKSVYLPSSELAKLDQHIGILDSVEEVRSYRQALETIFGQTGAITEYANNPLADRNQELMDPDGLGRYGDQQFVSNEAKAFLNKQDLAEAVKEQREEEAAKFGEGLSDVSQEPINSAPFLTNAINNAAKGIEDFGQKIGGARKDVWSGYLDKFKHSQNLMPREVPLSQYWPEPNYQKLLEAGHDGTAIATLRVLRDVVPTKPKTSYKLSAWNKKVEASKTLAEQIIGSIDKPDLLGPILDQFKTIPQISDAAYLYQIAGHERSLASYQIKCASYSMMNGVSYSPPKAIWSIEERSAKSSWPKQILTADTKEALLAQFAADHQTLLATANKIKLNDDVQFALYRKKAGKALYIGKKIGRRYIDLAGPFEDVKVAREYRHEHVQDLEETLARLKEVPSIRAIQNEPRLGIDYRQGQDISPEEFNEVFGFRGVEFGNWVEQGRRQADLNEAYDALMDLSRALAMPPASLSLNGELGLAFGARGRGGVDPAKAHYESGHVVINLTKEKGAGSLAHEWWHALDNYLVRSSPNGNPLGFVSDKPQAVNLREPLQEAFTAVMDQISASDLPKRSAKMDEFRSSAYWSTAIEMSARGFEGFVNERLSNLGIRNDYLVSYLAPKEWKASDLVRYPYPLEEEAKLLHTAFEHLFDQVKTRETDRGVAIFSEASGGPLPESERVDLVAARQLTQKLLQPFAKETRSHVHVIEGMDSIGIIHPPGFVASGVTCADHCFLAREGLRDLAAVEKTLWHEMLHLGLRRFLTPQQYIDNLNELYTQDQWIANKAKEWFDSDDGQQVFKTHSDNIDYVRARGVDEALAQLAEIIQTNPSGYQVNTLHAKAIRTVNRWAANLADRFGFHEAAKSYRAFSAGKDARNIVASTFQKLREGQTSIPGSMVDNERFKAALRSLKNAPVITPENIPPISSPIAQEIVMAKIAKDHQPPTVEPIPFNYQHPQFSQGTRPMWAPEVTPPQLIALGKEYFGSKREFIVPMQDGGPYKGEIYHHDDRFLFQQLGDDKFTLHQVTDLSSQSPIVKERMGKNFTGVYLSIHYEGNKGIVNPYDPFKDRFISNVQLVEKAAVDRDFSQKNQNLFKTMWRVALEDVMRARMGFPKAVAIVGEQTKPPGVLDPYHQDLKAFYQKQQLEDRAKAIKKASSTKVEEKAIVTTGPKR